EMAPAASVGPATASAPKSRGRQPAKERKISQGRGASAGAAEASLPGCATLSAPSTPEALSLILRTPALQSHETPPHLLSRADPAARRDRLGGQASLGEELAGRLDPQPLDRA